MSVSKTSKMLTYINYSAPVYPPPFGAGGGLARIMPA